MQYPLFIKFKIAAIASQVNVTDAAGTQLFYVKQKLFKLKENIEIFTDSSKTQKLYTVKADRVIDFSPQFTLYDINETELGSVKRRGRVSIWKATYELTLGNGVQLRVTESNPWAKVIDALFSEIPVAGLFTGYLFHPHYAVTDMTSGVVVSKLSKLPAFLEGKYSIEGVSTNYDENTHRTFAALMMVVVLRERMRG